MTMLKEMEPRPAALLSTILDASSVFKTDAEREVKGRRDEKLKHDGFFYLCAVHQNPVLNPYTVHLH